MYDYKHRYLNVNWATIYDEWRDGTGPEKSIFEGYHPANGWIEQNLAFQEKLAAFNESGLSKKKYDVNFTLWDVITTPEGDNQAQMMGSYSVSFYKLGDRILSLALDSKSRKSFYYHLRGIRNWPSPCNHCSQHQRYSKQTTTYQRYFFFTE
ncbi:hypothetical protein [Flavobacterium aurantiibacter]|uniref:Uncharacterized protein n=1 Tax=Flavobacterium aurantiibacter TaxID=2023067 RepID=A0A256AC35_9FLAO|nr:hypothetical protein [Flavobacterium aurantiibacter]OYQ51256.1 hypothetical protein CHX27_00410 [Flavobacterium aurantiibacter]